MSREARIPTYRRHKQSRQAIATLTDGLGGRRDVLLGKYGTAASRSEYARVLAETAEDRRVRRLVEFIQTQDGSITVRRLQCSNPTKYQTADQAEADLNDLARSGLGECAAQLTTEKGVHPSVLFVLKPHLTVDTTDTTHLPEEEGDTALPAQPPVDRKNARISRGSVSSVNCQVKENKAVPGGRPEASSQTTPGVVSSDPEYRREDNPFDKPEASL
jgi:hypothetical protein